MICKYEKCQLDLDNVLHNQRHVNDKSRLKNYKFENSSHIKKSSLSKSSNPCNNIRSRKACHNVQPRKAYNKKYFYDHEEKMTTMIHTCFYCNYKGDTTNTCYIRKFDIPSGKYVWDEKETNQKGSKEF